MVAPSYQELGPTQIPTAYPQGQDGPVKVKVISGKSHGVESPVRPLGGCWYVLTSISLILSFSDVRKFLSRYFHVIFKNKGTIFQEIRERLSFLY